MENGEVRLYNQKALIVTTGTGDGVEKINGVYFGPYGRESHCLITTSVSGQAIPFLPCASQVQVRLTWFLAVPVLLV